MSTTKSTNIKKRTNGRIALTPSTVSTIGVCSQIDGAAAVAVLTLLEAAAMISSGEIVIETKIARTNTAKMGNNDAIVTTPKPDSDELPFPAALAIPIPRDKTSGTVTGPVVTAPQSQASPRMLRKFGSNQA